MTLLRFPRAWRRMESMENISALKGDPWSSVLSVDGSALDRSTLRLCEYGN